MSALTVCTTNSPPAFSRDALDRVVSVDLCTCRARTPRQGEGELRRIDVPVQRIPPGAQEPVGAQQRMTTSHLVRIDVLELHANPAGHADVVLVGVHLLGGVRQPHAAGDVVVDGETLVGGKLAVEIDAVPLERDHGLVRTKLRHLRRRMPGRSRGQLVALHQNHVRPALLRQVIERRASPDAAPDDHHLGL